MTISVLVIEDDLCQRLVAQQELRKVVKCLAPGSPQSLLEAPDGVDIIFADRMMSEAWADARKSYIDRNPQAKVYEWSAVEDSLCDRYCELTRRDGKLIKTGTGRELVQAISKTFPDFKSGAAMKLAASMSAFLECVLYR